MSYIPTYGRDLWLPATQPVNNSSKTIHSSVGTSLGVLRCRKHRACAQTQGKLGFMFEKQGGTGTRPFASLLT